MDQQTQIKPVLPLDAAMAEALSLYDIAAKHNAPLLQAKALRIIAYLRAAQKAAL